MVLDQRSWRVPEAPGGVTIRLLEPDDEALGASRGVQNVAFGVPGRAPGPQGARERDAAIKTGSLDFLRDRHRRPADGHRRGRERVRPGRRGRHQPVGPVTEIVGVATLPAVRRQGLGGAVTGALVEDALAHGAETVFLSAGSEESRARYGRLGFRRIGTACIVG